MQISTISLIYKGSLNYTLASVATGGVQTLLVPLGNHSCNFFPMSIPTQILQPTVAAMKVEGFNSHSTTIKYTCLILLSFETFKAKLSKNN